MFRLFIFEGIDKVGKTELISEFAETLRSNNRNVFVLNNKKELKYYEDFSNFHTYIKTIDNFITKTYPSLITYFWSFLHFKNLDDNIDIIIDRLHFSELAYANFERKRELLRIFKTKSNVLSFFEDFEKSIVKIFDEIQCYCFVTDDTNTFSNDFEHPSIKQTSKNLSIVNKRYRKVFNLSKLKNKHLIEVSSENGYFNSRSKFNKLQF